MPKHLCDFMVACMQVAQPLHIITKNLETCVYSKVNCIFLYLSLLLSVLSSFTPVSLPSILWSYACTNEDPSHAAILVSA